MKRASLAVGALGGVLLLLAGCSSLDLGFDQGSGAASVVGNVRIMDGSPDTVAVTLQNTLQKGGLSEIKVDKGQEGVLVTARTKAGLVCGFMLTSVRAADGHEQTHINLDWRGGQDEPITVQLLAEIDRQGATKK